MKFSDCCGWPCDGVEGAEETGICGACKEHCEWLDEEPEEEAAPFLSLGWGNGWPAGTMPEELHRCRAKGHQMLESKMPCGGWKVQCGICRIEYMYCSN